MKAIEYLHGQIATDPEHAAIYKRSLAHKERLTNTYKDMVIKMDELIKLAERALNNSE